MSAPVPPALRITAAPEPVAAGGTLTYRVDVGRSAIAPQVTLHLPAGARHAKASGRGWLCEVATRSKDDYQSADHIEAECSSARMGLGSAPLTVTIEAPTDAVTLRACATAVLKRAREGSEACATSKVVP